MVHENFVFFRSKQKNSMKILSLRLVISFIGNDGELSEAKKFLLLSFRYVKTKRGIGWFNNRLLTWWQSNVIVWHSNARFLAASVTVLDINYTVSSQSFMVEITPKATYFTATNLTDIFFSWSVIKTYSMSDAK